jgi:hypothetical protein
MVQRARASAHPSAPKGPGGSLHTATCSPVQQRRPWLACQQTGGSHCALLACRPDGVRERVRRGSCRVWAALRISISGCGSPQMERAMEAAVPSDRRAPGPQLQARHAAARAAAHVPHALGRHVPRHLRAGLLHVHRRCAPCRLPLGATQGCLSTAQVRARRVVEFCRVPVAVAGLGGLESQSLLCCAWETVSAAHSLCLAGHTK